MRLLAISESLRSRSTNTAVLVAAGRLAPTGMSIALYEGLGQLPFFNPDLDNDYPPPAVVDLRKRIGSADGILICSPEYARGVAGAMKNALDWLVASIELPASCLAACIHDLRIRSPI